MAKAIIKILKNKELVREITEKAKKDVKKFGWEKIGGEILEVYEEVKK